MKRVFALTLALIMLMLLTACSGIKEEDVVGTWKTETADTAVQAEALLLNVDAYREEIALADLNSLKYVKVAEFREDGTYQFRVDAEGTKACVRNFFEGFFHSLYEGRTALNEVYPVTFDEMSEVEFQQFYAELYEAESFQILLDYFIDTAYDYSSLEKPMEQGTFTVRSNMIQCIETGESEPSVIKVAFSGENNECLHLTYTDGEEVYNRAN